MLRKTVHFHHYFHKPLKFYLFFVLQEHAYHFHNQSVLSALQILHGQLLSSWPLAFRQSSTLYFENLGSSGLLHECGVFFFVDMNQIMCQHITTCTPHENAMNKNKK
ncbi:hypothetical protein CIPAW_03G267700 [Carya illinoinensis]|uniref:Uncharacterized protein n=1 Tax=Carya illinoinensis TaxID=32201 RepID=A0A8T1R7E0_CARIL|nr:hypothetical protein CIPAW_03G267700 [Carya illinoinensis]